MYLYTGSIISNFNVTVSRKTGLIAYLKQEKQILNIWSAISGS